jgi:hypothetical protein
MKRHCCDDDRGCTAFDCDDEEAYSCECGCIRCQNAMTEDGLDAKAREALGLCNTTF